MATWGEPEPAPEPEPESALENLAAALDRQSYAASLVTGRGYPHLLITNRAAAQLTENIYCDGRYFWWSWAKRIAPAADITTARDAVMRVLRALDGAAVRAMPP